MRAVGILILVALVLTPSAFAVGQFSGDLSAVYEPSGQYLCDFDMIGEDPDDWYSYGTFFTRLDSCTRLVGQSVSGIDREWRVQRIDSSTETTREPYVEALGFRYSKDERGGPFRGDKEYVDYIIETENKEVEEPDYSDDYIIQKAGFCAEELDLTFSRFNTPDFDAQFDVWSSGDDGEDDEVDEDEYESCHRTVWNAFPSANEHPREPNKADSGLVYFQGWRLHPDSKLIQLPVLCGDIELRTTNPQAGDWDMPGGPNYRLSDNPEMNQIADAEGDNDFQFGFTYDEETKVLSDFTISMSDATRATGGFAYELWCIDPLGPEDSDIACGSVGGDWRINTEDTGVCCYENTVGSLELISEGGSNREHLCVDNEDNTYTWQGHRVVDCLTGSPDNIVNGQKLEQDDLAGNSYCCGSSNPEFANAPHLYNTNTQSFIAGDQEAFWCDGTTLRPTTEGTIAQMPWLYGWNEWKTCAQLGEGATHGRHVCNSPEEDVWQYETCDCSPGDRADCGPSEHFKLYCGFTDQWFVDPAAQGACTADNIWSVSGESEVCCHEGLFDYRVVETDSWPVIEACFMGTKIVETAGAAPASIEVEVS